MRSLPSKGAWSGQPAIVVGGGPSLSDFDWSSLAGVPHVIVINRAYTKVPTAEVFFTEDARFVEKFGNDPAFRAFGGAKVVHLLDDGYFHQIAPFADDLTLVRKRRRDKFWSTSFEDGLSVSSNSAIGAVNIADILGASRIYLLGMDCTSDGKRMNYHNDYPELWRTGKDQLRSFASDWEFWVKHKCKVPIVNVINPEKPSAVTCFPTMTFENFSLAMSPSEDARV